MDAELLSNYYRKRAYLEERKAELAQARQQWEESQVSEKEHIRQVEEALGELRESVEAQAKAGYFADDIKTREYGVMVKEVATMDFDPLKALEWAKEHSMCLALDKVAFKKVAKVESMDFIDYSSTLQVSMPTKKPVELV